MSYEELISLRDKEKRCDRVVAIFGTPSIITMIAIMFCLVLEVQLNASVLLIVVIVWLILGIITFIFGYIGDRCREKMEKYILSVVEKLIKINGVDTNSFEIFCDKENIYRVVFSSQKIDYKVLRRQIAFILGDLNKITGRNIQVKLV